MGACSSLAAAAGIEAPEISDEQMAQIFGAIGQEMIPYAPKFSIAYCACLCKEDQKHPEKVKVNELTETSIKLADDPKFDPATVAPPKKHHNEEEAEIEMPEEDEKESDQDITAGLDLNATTKTVCTAVVNSCGSIRSDMLAKIGQSEAIAGPVVDRALSKAVDVAIHKALFALALGITSEWRKLIKQGKDPKKVFLRAQAIAKTMSDIKAFIDDMEKLQDDVTGGASPLDVVADARDVANDAQDVNEDREKMKKNPEDKKKSRN